MASSDETYYILGVCMTLLLMLGTCLNLVVITVFRKLERKHKNLLNALIISVSVSNLFQSFIAYPINVVAAFHGKWIFGNSACIIDGFSVHWMALVSINHLVVFSVER